MTATTEMAAGALLLQEDERRPMEDLADGEPGPDVKAEVEDRGLGLRDLDVPQRLGAAVVHHRRRTRGEGDGQRDPRRASRAGNAFGVLQRSLPSHRGGSTCVRAAARKHGGTLSVLSVTSAKQTEPPTGRPPKDGVRVDGNAVGTGLEAGAGWHDTRFQDKEVPFAFGRRYGEADVSGDAPVVDDGSVFAAAPWGSQIE